MANLIPNGVDDSTGQNKQFSSGDALVDSTGSPILAQGSVATESTNTTSGATISRSIPGGTLAADGESLEFQIWGTANASGNTSF